MKTDFTNEFREEELFKKFLEKNYAPKKEEVKTKDIKTEKPTCESDDYTNDTPFTLKNIIPSLKDENGLKMPLFKAIFYKKNIEKFTVFIFIAFLTFFLALNIFTPSKKVSTEENRALQMFPTVSFERITNGKFMSDFENYIQDQFVFRNHFVKSKLKYELLSGKSENHQILICDNYRLIENSSEISWENVKPNIDAINTLSKLDRYNVKVLVIPTSYEISKDSLPKFAYVNSYGSLQNTLKRTVKNASVIDCAPILRKHKNEYLYYYSDHHQSAHASYYIYEDLGKSLGYEPIGKDNFDIKEMSDSFLGTMWSNSGFAPTKKDTIFDYSLKNPYTYKVEFPYEKKTMDSLYNKEHLSKKDKYAYYLDGNHSITKILSSVANDKKLAIIKDSYAHSIAPFLANHFSEIHLIDLRYYNDDIFKYLYDNGINDVLFLYNQNTFMQDSNLQKISHISKTSSYTSVPDVSYGKVPLQNVADDSYFDDAVFVGDSLTIGIQNFSGFNATFLCMGGLSTKNLATDPLPNGKTTIDSIKSMEHIGKIYIMLGTNEVAFNKMDEYLKRYSEFIDEIRKTHPDAIIYIESIMPVTKETSDTTQIKNDRIKVYNKHLVELAKEKQCYYVDVNSYFLDSEGYMPSNIGSDGIHLGPEKYKELSTHIKNHSVKAEGVKKINTKKQSVFEQKSQGKLIEIANGILSEVNFKDELMKVSDSLIVSTYNVDSKKVSSAVLYLGGGSTSEEIAVFELKNANDAKWLEGKIKERVERKKDDFRNYIPKEMEKLNSPYIITKGKTVVLCIADKASKDDILKLIK